MSLHPLARILVVMGISSPVAIAQCPPTWVHIGLHEENIGAAFVGSGDEAYVGSFGAAVGSGARRIESQPAGTWIFAGGFGGTSAGALASGASLDVHGDLGVVGDPGDGTLAPLPIGHGAFELAKRINGAWTTVATTFPPVPKLGMRFGHAVCISENGADIAVSAPFEDGVGAVYLYSEVAGTWTPTALVQPSSLSAGDGFGESCRFVGGRLFVGAPQHGGTGGVFVFEWQGGGWSQSALLVPAGSQPGDAVGWRVVGTGDSVHVAAPHSAHALGSGVVVRFDRIGTSWVESGTIAPFGAAPVGQFGDALDLQGERLAVGAGGRAFVFRDGSSGWEPLTRVDEPPGIFHSKFGSSVALVDDGLLVGAPLLDDNGYDYPDHMGGIFAYDLADAGEPLVACGHEISLGTGGAQRLVLDAAASANHPFLIVGSMTGATATNVHGIALPLTPDPYFDFTVAVPGGPTLPGGAAILDAKGRAEADFVVPAGLSPSLAGLAVHHAFVTYAPGLGPTFVSNAVSITLVP